MLYQNCVQLYKEEISKVKAMKTIKNMKNKGHAGIVLATALFAMVMLGILITAVSLRMNLETRGTDAQRDTTISMHIAEAGIEDCLDQLRRNPALLAGPVFVNQPLLDIDGNTAGFYTVNITSRDIASMQPWVIVSISSTGNLVAGDTSFQRTINADIITANPADFFAFVDDRAVISNGAVITNGSLYAREIEFNINPLFGDLIINQPTFFVAGYGYNVNDPDPVNPPNVIFNQLPQAMQSPVAFPAINEAYYQVLAAQGGRALSGNQTFNGLALGGGENGIIYVDGDVYIQGIVNDPIAVVATGNIHITGDITWQLDANGDPVGKLGLFAKGDVIIEDTAPPNINIRAQIITEGVFKTEGFRSSKDNLRFDGSMAVKGAAGQTAVDLTVYAQRQYNYDQSLVVAPLIPASPNVANIISWQEQ
jgi:hypothetical protein